MAPVWAHILCNGYTNVRCWSRDHRFVTSVLHRCLSASPGAAVVRLARSGWLSCYRWLHERNCWWHPSILACYNRLPCTGGVVQAWTRLSTGPDRRRGLDYTASDLGSHI